jgi:hypothetical protein
MTPDDIVALHSGSHSDFAIGLAETSPLEVKRAEQSAVTSLFFRRFPSAAESLVVARNAVGEAGCRPPNYSVKR